MTAAMPGFRLVTPRSLAEALAARAADPLARFLAGGTDLLPAMARGLVEPETLIDIGMIAELAGIAVDGDRLRIGAATTLARLQADALVARHAPVLASAAATVAGPQHRTAATVGGNLCLDTRCVFYNQSQWWRRANGFCLKREGTVCHVAPTGTRCHAAFSGDLAPAAMVLDASVEIAGPGGRRIAKLCELYRDDGAAPLCLGDEELLVALHVPAASGWIADYAKSRVRGAIDFPLAGVAVALRRSGDTLAGLRVALTGTGSRPFRLAGTDAEIGHGVDDAALERLDKLVQKQVSPMRSTMTPAHYRRRVAAALTRRLVRRLFAEAAQPPMRGGGATAPQSEMKP
ncbi:MAG: 4-hydroxybenzoyl-CoA reductase subunit beta [Alphaproteobacteria bacterium]|nr:4-hydroxybenzoyl-CoA reductase subunit beta [Alphaproteobacteria bacterium]